MCTLQPAFHQVALIIVWWWYTAGGGRGEASGAATTHHSITGGETKQSLAVSFCLPDIQLIMPSCVSRTAGDGALTVPVLITGKRAPERWDASWHLGLILTSINTSRGSPWSDYRREWRRNRNVGKQGGWKEEEEEREERAEDWIYRWCTKGEEKKGGEKSSWMMKGVSRSCSEGGWWPRRLSGVHGPAAVGPNDGGHRYTPRWGPMPVINTTWWGVWAPSDVHQNGICFFPLF